MRLVVFLTDGLVGNEAAILQNVRDAADSPAQPRYFAIGVGTSVNRYLIEGIAAMGAGRAGYASTREPADRAAERLYRSIDAPVLRNVSMDWGPLDVRDVYPARLTDVWAGQPLVFAGRFRNATGADQVATLHVRAKRGTQELDIPVPVTFPQEQAANASLASVWARRRIGSLTAAMNGEGTPAQVQEITQLALEYGLVSQYTAFLAIDSSTVVGDGHPLRVLQPVELPADTSREGIFGPSTTCASIPLWGVTVAEAGDGSVVVVAVAPDSPAAAAGLAPGDRLWGVSGTQVTGILHLDSLLQQRTATASDVQLRTGDHTRTVQLP